MRSIKPRRTVVIGSCYPMIPDWTLPAFRTKGRYLLGTVLLILATSAFAADLDERIEQARQLSLSDPAGSGWALLQELEAERQDASPEQQAEIELIILRSLALKGELDQALERASALAERPIEIDLRISAMRLAANIAMNAGRFETAFNQLVNALNLLEGVDSPQNEVSIFGLASFFHSRSGDSWLAVDYGEQAVASAQRADDSRLKCTAMAWLAYAHAAQENRELARDLSLRAREFCDEAQDLVTGAFVSNLLARIALDSGQLDQAEQHVERAAAMNLGTYRDGQIESKLIRARLHLQRGEYQESLARYRALVTQLSSDLRIDRLAEALDGAAASAAQLGEMESAVEFHKRHVDALRSHLERTRSLEMAQLSTAFDRASREQNIALLREQQRVNDLTEKSRVQRQRLRILAAAGVLIVIVLLFAWLVHALRERRHFRQLSDRDSLTQLYNHTRFFKQLDRELPQLRGRSLALIMADIDHFKQVNDRFGHQIGDEVLRQTARVLRDVFGAEELIGRIGGEEFAVRLLGCSQTEAIQRVQILQERLAGRTRRRTDPPITMSFGLGMAEPGESLESLRQRTDHALYRAKQQGRNRALLAEPMDSGSNKDQAE